MGGQEIIDRKLEAFKKLVPHLRGALWWGSNPLIQERNSTFNQSDTHKGHPLLVVFAVSFDRYYGCGKGDEFVYANVFDSAYV